MQKIDEQMMENICILSKLYLDDEEKEKAKEQMQKMLDYVEKLNDLDTEKTETDPYLFEVGNVFREDVVEELDMKEELLSQAPAKKDGQYEVPKTIG